MTGLSIPPFTQGFKIDHRAEVMLGKVASALGINMIEISPKKPYGHPVLRQTVDIMTSFVIRSTRESLLIDIGSKYHKIAKYRHQPFIAVRAPLFGYDKLYASTNRYSEFT